MMFHLLAQNSAATLLLTGRSVPAPAATQAATLPAATQAATDPLIAHTLTVVESIQTQLQDAVTQNSLKRWMILLLLSLAGLVLGRLCAFILTRIAKRLEQSGWHAQGQIFSGLASPLSLGLFTIGLSLGLAQLKMSDPLQKFSGHIILMLALIALFWYVFNFVAVLEVALFKVTHSSQSQLDDQLVPIIRKILRILIVVIAALFILQNVFNQDIGAWLAGLGIAGLAVSLSAQDSLKNLFGSITIFFDHPFSVGHEIKYGGYDGTVEDIGFRSTKIRTADGSLVTIPNSNIVNNPVDNWGVRTTQRRLLNIHLTYDTPVEKVRRAIEITRELLESPDLRGPIHDEDPKNDPNPPRVYFNDFNSDSLNIQVFYWFRSMDGWKFAEHAERFNLRLMEAFAKENIEFSTPARTTYVPPTPPPPAK